ncbi:unnamed protein product [Cylicocyclus nassatus]|uniref:Uncharacterized protein n=1 Tax=Cylicocyclus nassatus TaxID=53992 RepID=A0AA36GUQ0_CYLNA|nr:unnamed protein product [Cylicocyclus nassatus]
MNFLLISLLLFSILGVSLGRIHCKPHCTKVCKNHRVKKCHGRPPRCTFINHPVCHQKCTHRRC